MEYSKKYFTDVIQVIEEEKNKIQVACNIFECEIQNKLLASLHKNSGYKIMKIFSKVLEGKEVSKNGLLVDMNENNIPYFKYAPITSVEVERSFSLI